MFQFILPAVGMAAQVAGSLLTKGSNATPPNLYGPGSPLDQERQRQRVFQGQANDVVDREIGRFDSFPGQMETKAKTLADFFATNSGGLPAGGPTAGVMPASKSMAVIADAKPRMDKVAAYNTQQNEGLANVRSFADAFGDVNRGVMGDRSEMANINNFRAGSRALTPLEMKGLMERYQLASQPPDNTFADILKGAGKVATSAGLSGFNPFGSGAFVGTPEGLSTYGSPGYAATTRFGGPK